MMLTGLEQKVADFIAAEGLLTPGEKVLLALSGGADSTALLHAMASLRADGVLPVEIHCAHINHQLRGDEAERDEDFVVEQCRILKITVFTKQIDVRGYAGKEKLSIETAARILRIDSLVKIAKEQNCTCIATAHHKNDNAETVLYRLIRGTGFRGLCGIWPAKEFTSGIRFVRPLLCAARDEIIQYLNGRNLTWCSDRTNEDCSYRRNHIRHCLMPFLQRDFKTDLVEQLAGLAKASRGFYRQVCERADSVWQNAATVDKGTVTLDFDKLAAQPTEVRIELVRRVLANLAGGERNITERHYVNVLELSDGGKLQLPQDIEVYRQGDKAVFTRSPKKEMIETGKAEQIAINVPGRTRFGSCIIDAEVLEIEQSRFDSFKKNKTNLVEWFDFEKLKLPLEVRFRKGGDRFWPLGMPGEKKVGKFLTSAKVTPASRRKLLVIADSEKIIWLCPVRISERVKVTNKTKMVLQLKFCS